MNQDDFKKLVEEALEPIKQKQESHSGALMRIESILEGYADAYKVNKGNIERLDERLSSVEDNLDIQPISELAIQK